jgi:hypothetical protein
VNSLNSLFTGQYYYNMNNIKAKNSIQKGKYNHIGISYSDDWVILSVNGFSYYEGEDITDEVWLELLELMTGAETEIEYDS